MRSKRRSSRLRLTAPLFCRSVTLRVLPSQCQSCTEDLGHLTQPHGPAPFPRLISPAPPAERVRGQRELWPQQRSSQAWSGYTCLSPLNQPEGRGHTTAPAPPPHPRRNHPSLYRMCWDEPAPQHNQDSYRLRCAPCVPSPVLRTFQTRTGSTPHSLGAGAGIMPILQMRKSRLREVRPLAEGHMVTSA